MKQYIVDAFTDQIFHGNQAAICIMDEWLPEHVMMGITRENNFSETAFAVPEGSRYHLRWFTPPGGEIDLCGHATLACASVILRFYRPQSDSVTFDTLSGTLTVARDKDLLDMEFPAYDLREVPVTDAMEGALGTRPMAAYMGRDLLCILDSAETVRNLQPNQAKMQQLEGLLCHVTAPAPAESPYDCISRSFAPKLAVAEDPVCGSGHCHIVPYWAYELGKADITAYQASERGGTLYCRIAGDKVHLAGETALFSVAEIQIQCVEP